MIYTGHVEFGSMAASITWSSARSHDARSFMWECPNFATVDGHYAGGIFEHGFDFYAPQVMGRSLLIGRAGMMTIIFSTPVKELESLRQFGTTYENFSIDKATQLQDISGEVGEFLLDVDTKKSAAFKIKLRSSKKEATLLSYDGATGIFSVNRDKSGKGSGGTREVKLAPADRLKLQVFIDRSSVEIFLNYGEAVMSTRIYPQKNSEVLMVTAVDDALK